MIDRIRQLEANLDVVFNLETISDRMAKNPEGYMLTKDTHYKGSRLKPTRKTSLKRLIAPERP
jgi:hypothetical protein